MPGWSCSDRGPWPTPPSSLRHQRRGVRLLGLEPYRAWIGILRAPEYLHGRPIYGNLSLLTWLTFLALPLAQGAVAATVAAVVRGQWPALIACMALGLLVAPYPMAYAAVVLLVVAKPLATVAPRATLALAFLAPILILLAFPRLGGRPHGRRHRHPGRALVEDALPTGPLAAPHA